MYTNNLKKTTIQGVKLLRFLVCAMGAVTAMHAQDHKYTNALIQETSPYLLQHAHNPVDWMPWGEKALSLAKSQNRLLLISIGYSSCHWCHVMEEETFEDAAVAQLMNANFINIKVDREERPDIDELYQTFISLIDKDRGWPLNIIALPNGKPLYGGLYHSKTQWQQVLNQINSLYQADPTKAEEYANMLASGIQEHNIIKPEEAQTYAASLPKEAIEKWKADWDVTWGGFKGDNKFMLPSNLMFLLQYSKLTKDKATKEHLKLTLDMMANRGVYDHIGGGFYRYSTDKEWKIPHFEKMLYDNAQLLSLYAKAYVVFKDERYKEVAAGIASFLEREMYNGQGGYYAAMDADVDGEEGQYYVWELPELESIIKKDFDLFRAYYDITPNSVWENNTYVLANPEGLNIQTFAKAHGVAVKDLKAKIKGWHHLLLDYRAKRKAPRIDDKILCSWNALLVSGYVEAYKAFGRQEYLNKAKNIVAFLQNHHLKNGQLTHAYKKNSKNRAGFLEDYAFLIQALIDVYSVSMDQAYLDLSLSLYQAVQKDYADGNSSMYRYNNNQALISQIIKTDDGVIPSGNSIMAQNLFRIGQLYHNNDMLKTSEDMLSLMVAKIKDSPSNYSQWSSLLLYQLHPYYQIAIVGQDAKTKLQAMHGKSVQNAIIVGSAVPSDLPMFQNRYVDGGTYIYVCQNNSCKMPVRTVAAALEQVKGFN